MNPLEAQHQLQAAFNCKVGSSSYVPLTDEKWIIASASWTPAPAEEWPINLTVPNTFSIEANWYQGKMQCLIVSLYESINGLRFDLLSPFRIIAANGQIVPSGLEKVVMAMRDYDRLACGLYCLPIGIKYIRDRFLINGHQMIESERCYFERLSALKRETLDASDNVYLEKHRSKPIG